MQLRSLLVLAVLAAPLAFTQARLCAASTPEAPFSESSLPKVIEPSIPARSINLKDFGAVPDGLTSNTQAFAKAIDALAEQGGGRLIIPGGVWLTGPIVLKSHIELHLERGALIQFSSNTAEYPLIETYWEGQKGVRCQSPLSGEKLEDIAITGEGILDGAGDAWRPVKRDKTTAPQWNGLVASGGVTDDSKRFWFPSESSKLGHEQSALRESKSREDLARIHDYFRPVMVSLTECQRVLIQGVTIQNSPAWCLHPLLCENVTLRGIAIRNPWYAQNGDAMDLESSRNALIEDSLFDAGDDAICLKSGRDAEGRKRGRPTENVIIRGCTVYHGHGGFVIGSEMSGGVRNVSVHDCTFIGTDTGLRFKSTRGRGGVVERIDIRRIRMSRIEGEAVLFDMFYMGRKSAGAEAIPAVTEETPIFRDITLDDIVCSGARRAALFQGLPEMALERVRMTNSSFDAEKGIRIVDTKGLFLSGLRLNAAKGELFDVINSAGITLSDLRLDRLPDQQALLISGPRSGEILLEKGAGLLAPKAQIDKTLPASVLSIRP